MQVDDLQRREGRPKSKWMEVERIDIKKCKLNEDLAHDELEWRNIIM